MQWYLVGLLVVSCWGANIISSTPVAEDDDIIEFYYLESPLMKDSLGNALAVGDGYHGGVGFRSTKKGWSWCAEYLALEGMIPAVFPDINMSKPLGSELAWRNTGVVHLIDLDQVYWEKALYMGVMKKNQYDAMVCWINGYMDDVHHQHYSLFDVYQGSFAAGQHVIKASTCVVFVWEAFLAAYDFGIDLQPFLFAKHDVVTMYTSETPVEVTSGGPAQEWTDMVAFYNDFEDVFSTSSNDTVAQRVDALMDRIIAKNTTYIRTSDNKYWKLKALDPIIDFSYYLDPLPTGTPNPKAHGSCCSFLDEQIDEDKPNADTSDKADGWEITAIVLILLVGVMGGIYVFRRRGKMRMAKEMENPLVEEGQL